jgi:hypothetical protein
LRAGRVEDLRVVPEGPRGRPDEERDDRVLEPAGRETEREHERGDVAEHHVLAHVRDEQPVRLRRERRHDRHRDERGGQPEQDPDAAGARGESRYGARFAAQRGQKGTTPKCVDLV